jgi:hypothetical protein
LRLCREGAAQPSLLTSFPPVKRLSESHKKQTSNMKLLSIAWNFYQFHSPKLAEGALIVVDFDVVEGSVFRRNTLY